MQRDANFTNEALKTFLCVPVDVSVFSNEHEEN